MLTSEKKTNQFQIQKKQQDKNTKDKLALTGKLDYYNEIYKCNQRRFY